MVQYRIKRTLLRISYLPQNGKLLVVSTKNVPR